jgi:nicotinamidase-related amidase
MTSTPGIDPARTALLLMDFQSGIVDSFPGRDALLQRAAAARETTAAAGVHTVYVRVAFTDDARARVSDRNKSFAAVAGTDRLAVDAPDTQIHATLRPRPGDTVVTKTRVGAFSTTDLADQLAARGIDTLVLSGIATSGVVLSTVRDAADHDYRLFVLADCCGDRDEEVHRLLIERVFVRQADIIESADLSALLGAPRPG